jgi:hypothetical protein
MNESQSSFAIKVPGHSAPVFLVLAVAAVGILLSTASVAVLAAALGGDAILAAKVVDAIIAGSTAATIAAILATGGFAGIGLAAVRFALKTAGRKAAIS